VARERLGDILIKAGLLEQGQLRAALNEQERWGGPLGGYLVQMGYITEETLVRALSTQFKLPAVALDPPRLNLSVARLIPQEICERNGLICFRANDARSFLDVAMADPSSLDAIDEVRVATRANVRPFFATPSSIDEAIAYVFYGDVEGAMGGVIDLSPQSGMRIDPGSSPLTKQSQEGPPPVLEVKVTSGSGDYSSPGDLSWPSVASVSSSPSMPSSPSELRQGSHGGTDDFMHISTDSIDALPHLKPSTGKETTINERVAHLEAMNARLNTMLELLMGLMVEKGLLASSDISNLLKRKD
jgi:hypothetical protein